MHYNIILRYRYYDGNISMMLKMKSLTFNIEAELNIIYLILYIVVNYIIQEQDIEYKDT